MYIGVSLTIGLSNGLGGEPRKECNDMMFVFIPLMLCNPERVCSQRDRPEQ